MFNNSYVYIMKDKKTNLYKIGKANNIFKRFFQIVGPFTFLKVDYKNSYYIKCSDEKEALELENFFHKFFYKKHVNPKYAPYKDGKTEWFHLDEKDIDKIKKVVKDFKKSFGRIGLLRFFLQFFIRNKFLYNLMF